MEFVIFLVGIAVLMGLGMFLAWPCDEEIGLGERHREHVSTSWLKGKA